MTPRDALRLDILAARYLEALEASDFDTMAELWRQAGTDPDLEAVLHELHAGLIEERLAQEALQTSTALAEAVQTHLPSAQVLAPRIGPVTVAEVAEALFRNPPGRLPAEAHRLNEKLRTVSEALPEQLGLSKLSAWAEGKFGAAPRAYWLAFREAALALEMERAAGAQLGMAARPAARPEDKR